MRAVLADTGPLYAAADVDDADHELSLRQVIELDRDDRAILVPYSVLLEAYSLVLKRFGIRLALQWLSNMAEASLINPTPEDYSVACHIVRAFSDRDISLVDATTATLAGRLKLQVWTYDHHFDVMRVHVWRG